MREGVDISAAIGPGAYVLRERGAVVYVGFAHRSMLAQIAGHRSAARRHSHPWSIIRGIVFDSVEVFPGATEAEAQDMVDDLLPRLNEPVGVP